MKVIKTNIKAETVEINPREAEALRNTFQDNRRTYNDNIRKYAKQMKDGKWKARTTKTIFLLLAGYLGLQCIRASLWIPLILCILLFTFIIQLKNKEL